MARLPERQGKATELERIAYAVEEADHRGTLHFVELPHGEETGRGLIGFHGTRSMMSMDAISLCGFTLANFCDTSGNPSAGKVYRAARIILAQPGLVGYFGSGGGVASQAQHHSAYGLAKAFRELELSVPAVVRLGGNGEDRAVEILARACAGLPAPVEGYRQDDTPAAIAERFGELVDAAAGSGACVGGTTWTPRPRCMPAFAGTGDPYPIAGGTLWIDAHACDAATSAWLAERSGGLLRWDGQRGSAPAPAVALEELATKDSELIALEIECAIAGRPVVFVDLPVDGLDP